MKKKMIAIALSSILLVGCGTTKKLDECCKKETKTAVVSHDKDPLANLLASAIIIFAFQILTTK